MTIALKLRGDVTSRRCDRVSPRCAMRYVFSVPGLVAATVMVVLGASAPVAVRADTPAAQAGAVAAVWTTRQKRYTYMGFTSRYSCDGLRDKIRATLLK